MEAFIIYTGIASVLAFILFGIDKRRQHYGKSPMPSALLIVAGVLAPFGALMGMLLFNNRLRQPLFIILVPLMLIAYVLCTYLFGHELLC